MPKQGSVIDATEQAVAVRQPEAVERIDADESVSMFERLARDPNVDVEKIERLIAMQERVTAQRARAAFNAAFAEMQGELPIIDEKGQILVNGTLRSRFARHEDIQEAVKPILAQHGFSLSHRNKRLENGNHLIVGVLRHRDGHSEEDEFECKADASGGKNDVQAIGSTREYGRRYTSISLLGIVTKGVDDDAKSAAKAAPEPPKGFDDWLTDWEATADQGFEILNDAWKASNVKFTNYMNAHGRDKKAEIIAKAKAIDKAKAGRP